MGFDDYDDIDLRQEKLENDLFGELNKSDSDEGYNAPEEELDDSFADDTGASGQHNHDNPYDMDPDQIYVDPTKTVDAGKGQQILNDIKSNDPFGKNRIGWGVFGSILEAFRVIFEYIGLFIRGIVFGSAKPSDFYERLNEQEKANEYKNAKDVSKDTLDHAKDMADHNKDSHTKEKKSTELANTEGKELKDDKSKDDKKRSRFTDEQLDLANKKVLSFMQNNFALNPQQKSELDIHCMYSAGDVNGNQSLTPTNCFKMGNSSIDCSKLGEALINGDKSMMFKLARVFEGAKIIETGGVYDKDDVVKPSLTSQVKARLMAISIMQQAGLSECYKDGVLKPFYDVYHIDIAGGKKANGIVVYINAGDKENKDWSTVDVVVKDYSQDPPKSIKLPKLIDISTLDKDLMEYDLETQLNDMLTETNYENIITAEDKSEQSTETESNEQNVSDGTEKTESETSEQSSTDDAEVSESTDPINLFNGVNLDEFGLNNNPDTTEEPDTQKTETSSDEQVNQQFNDEMGSIDTDAAREEMERMKQEAEAEQTEAQLQGYQGFEDLEPDETPDETLTKDDTFNTPTGYDENEGFDAI